MVQIAREIHNRDFVGDIEGLELHGVPVGLWNARQGGVVNVIGAEPRVKRYDDAASSGGSSLIT